MDYFNNQVGWKHLVRNLVGITIIGSMIWSIGCSTLGKSVKHEQPAGKQTAAMKIVVHESKTSTLPMDSSKEVRAIWLHGRYIDEEGVDKVVDRLTEYRINTVILLVKGIGGSVDFQSATARVLKPEKDTLRDFITACHKRRMEVHAWLMYHGDTQWVTNHPEEGMYKAGDSTNWNAGPVPVNKEKVCPLAPGYHEYFLGLIGDLIDNYDIDGIHLDGIRYGHMLYCFCPRHQQKAKELGIDLDHIRALAYKMLYVQKSTKGAYINAYKKGDKDVVKWVQQRQDEITSVTKEVKELIQKKKPNLKLSAALMPEGGEADDTFALCHYGQNYRELGKYLDFICPMSYQGGFGKKTDWVVAIAKRVEAETGKPVYVGVQGFGLTKTFTVAEFTETLKAVKKDRLHGFTIFRYGTLNAEMEKAVKEN
ncbi:MAG: glycoside hydrolase family 10 protein [bacterium]